MKKCNIDCYEICQRDIYKDNNKCVLHCKKNLPNKKQTLNNIYQKVGQNYFKSIIWLIGFSLLYNFILYGYKQNYLYKIYPTVNHSIQNFTNFFNDIAKNILPFSKFLKKDLEFLSLLFYMIFSILIWQIIVSIKRYTKR